MNIYKVRRTSVDRKYWGNTFPFDLGLKINRILICRGGGKYILDIQNISSKNKKANLNGTY